MTNKASPQPRIAQQMQRTLSELIGARCATRASARSRHRRRGLAGPESHAGSSSRARGDARTLPSKEILEARAPIPARSLGLAQLAACAALGVALRRGRADRDARRLIGKRDRRRRQGRCRRHVDDEDKRRRQVGLRARRRRVRPLAHRDVDGILLLDKPPGLSLRTRAAARRARCSAPPRRATPAASIRWRPGMLPICFGAGDQGLRRAAELGARPTECSCSSARAPTPATPRAQSSSDAAVPPLDDRASIAALATFLGGRQQVPPMYSALKRDGEPLYELARRGESSRARAAPIVIDRFARALARPTSWSST